MQNIYMSRVLLYQVIFYGTGNVKRNAGVTNQLLPLRDYVRKNRIWRVLDTVSAWQN
jgi:hypothetical protein